MIIAQRAYNSTRDLLNYTTVQYEIMQKIDFAAFLFYT